MSKTSLRFSRVMPLGLVVLSLVGCSKVKSVVGELKSLTGEPKKEVPSKPALSAAEGGYSEEQIVNLTSASHAGFIARANALVIVDFHAEWCGPCQQLGPVLVKATTLHPSVVYLGRVDVDQVTELVAAQQVTSIPDVRIYRNGREVDRFVGFPGEASVLEKVAKLSVGIIPGSAAGPALKQFSKGWLPAGMSRPVTPVPKKP